LQARLVASPHGEGIHLLANVLLALKLFPGTNTLAYLATSPGIKKKKFLYQITLRLKESML
jgi:hypothetical protein